VNRVQAPDDQSRLCRIPFTTVLFTRKAHHALFPVAAGDPSSRHSSCQARNSCLVAGTACIYNHYFYELRAHVGHGNVAENRSAHIARSEDDTEQDMVDISCLLRGLLCRTCIWIGRFLRHKTAWLCQERSETQRAIIEWGIILNQRRRYAEQVVPQIYYSRVSKHSSATATHDTNSITAPWASCIRRHFLCCLLSPKD